MSRIEQKASLLNKYRFMYEKKPSSKVFAPLAEIYRKLGMKDEALKVLRDGLRYHPKYVLGLIVLAQIYFDQGEFELAYTTIEEFVPTNLENHSLQKIFGQICLETNRYEQALNSYKYLLLLYPQNESYAHTVNELEEKLQKPVVLEKEGYLDEQIDEDDWVLVDFMSKQDDSKQQEPQWQMKKELSLESVKSDLTAQKIEVEELDLNSSFYKEEYDEPAQDVISPDNTQNLKSLKLVDLYIDQQHYEKANELLEDLNNSDLDIIEISQRKVRLSQAMKSEQKLDELLSKAQNKFEIYEKRLLSFRSKIQKRASLC